MKPNVKILAAILSLMVAVFMFSCNKDDDWFKPESKKRTLYGNVIEFSSGNPVEGVYMALLEGENCDFISGDCEDYRNVGDGYSANDGSYSMSYYGTAFVDLIMREGRVSVFVDSLNAYKNATVKRFKCPTTSDYWYEATKYPYTYHHHGVRIDDKLELNILVELELEDR